MANDYITGENVYRCAGAPSPDDIEFVLQVLLNRSFAEAVQNIDDLRKTKRFSLTDILTELVKKLQEITFPPKAETFLYKEIAELELVFFILIINRYRLTSGTDEEIQLASLVGIFVKIRGMM